MLRDTAGTVAVAVDRLPRRHGCQVHRAGTVVKSIRHGCQVHHAGVQSQGGCNPRAVTKSPRPVAAAHRDSI